MSNVLDIAKKINKSYKQEILTDGSIISECQKISMGSIASDFAVNGGIPLGAITVYAGLEGSGKTTAAVQTMAEYQKAFPDRTCVYVDAEQTLVTQLDFFVRMTGLVVDDPNRFLRFDTTGMSAEEIFAALLDLQQADNIGLIVIDSAPALISQADMDSDFTKDNGMRASVAKNLGKFLRNMVMYLPKRNNALIIINQVREAGKTFTGATIYTEPCGYGLRYYPSLKVRFASRCYTQGDKTDLAASKGEDADGFRLRFSITKSRLSRVKGGGFMTYRYETGRDIIGDTLEVALKYGYIQRPTMQSYALINLNTGEIYKDPNTGEDLKFIGKQKLIDYLNSNVDFRTGYVQMLSEHINASNTKSLLDDDTMKEIMDQENSVEGTVKHNSEFEDEPNE